MFGSLLPIMIVSDTVGIQVENGKLIGGFEVRGLHPLEPASIG